MGRLLTLGFLALLAVAEVAAVLAMVSWLGPTTALLLLAADVAAGIVVIRWALRSGPEGRGWRITAGVFIALPGFVLDGLGLLLLIPGVQRWLGRLLSSGTETLLRRQGMRVVTVTDASGAERTTVVTTEVIPGEVIDPSEGATRPAAGDARRPSSGQQAPWSGSPPGPRGSSGPTVIRGEIVGPDEESS